MSSRRANGAARRAGFTLVELMVVVCILGILSAIAIPMFADYIGKSRSVEGVGFLAEVKARQESYRFDFGMYCDVSTARSTYFPDRDPGRTLMMDWQDTALLPANWRVLGAMPSGGGSRFVYSSVASAPGGVLPNGKGFNDTRGYPAAAAGGPTDFWFITTAVGDLNENCAGVGDTACNMVLESYSHTKGIYSSRGVGWE